MAPKRATGGTATGWATTYPPMLSLLVVFALVLAVMPSALNLPENNPQTTPEYAPVPPDENAPPPPTGNFDSLGLASNTDLLGEGFGGDQPFGTPPPPREHEEEQEELDDDDGSTTRTRTVRSKKCVGSPPRQTEDPSSPPCVAHFEGDNFGATHQGVTAKEVRVLVYVDSTAENSPGDSFTSRGSERRPADTYVDLGKPGTPDDHIIVRVLRAWQRYFNERYQTYDRTVRFVVYFPPRERPTPASRRRDAAGNYEQVKPFALISNATRGFEDSYLEAMAEKGVLNFGSFGGREADFYHRFAPHIWGYAPSIDQQAVQFAGYVCTKVVPHRISFGGNDGHPDERLHNGQPRRLGLIWTDDAKYPGLKRFAEIVRTRVKACGGNIVADRSVPFNAGVIDERYGDNLTYAAENMAYFSHPDVAVSTVIWAQGYENLQSKEAARLNYRPEWVIAGGGRHEGYNHGQFQEQSVWRHAWVVTNETLKGDLFDTPCMQSLEEADPSLPDEDTTFACGFYPYYNDLRQLFTGIQVAGPRLTPNSLDKGMHAIPPFKSDSPKHAACFYEANDFTCVKDSAAAWYNPDGRARDAQGNGCWMWARGGERFATGQWPAGDVLNMKTEADRCNNFGGSYDPV